MTTSIASYPRPNRIVRLDQLEALVRQRRGVDRDLRAHGPGGMCERLIRRHPLQLLARPASKRTARRSEHQRVDRFAVAFPEALESGRVLTVDGQQPTSPTLLRREREITRSDQALLVREREVDAALESPERRGQAGEADDGIKDDVRLCPLEQLGRGRRRPASAARGRRPAASRRPRRRARDPDARR